MDRVFLDANVLFSAAYRADSGLHRLWALEDAELVTSEFALEEARRNLATESQRELLARMAQALERVADTATIELPGEVELAQKVVPILAAALAGGCSHLVTGDRGHFGHLFGDSVGGVLIVTPRQYLESEQR